MGREDSILIASWSKAIAPDDALPLLKFTWAAHSELSARSIVRAGPTERDTGQAGRLLPEIAEGPATGSCREFRCAVQASSGPFRTGESQAIGPRAAARGIGGDSHGRCFDRFTQRHGHAADARHARGH